MIDNYDDVIAFAKSSKFLSQWHWFGYHFRRFVARDPSVFVQTLVISCLEVDQKIEGFAERFLTSLSEIGGIERHQPHYEQLLQRLAELVVIYRLVHFQWTEKAEFYYEPISSTSKKNPEIGVRLGERYIAVEVKAPSLLAHRAARRERSLQVPARGVPKELVDQLAPGDITLPRDYPVRDFLVSANEKFKGFVADDPRTCGILVIVWDDHVHEPLSVLTSPASGLLSSQSWAKDSQGAPLVFPFVSAVILVQHLHVFVAAAAGELLPDGRMNPFGYGSGGSYPPKLLIDNPKAITPPDAEAIECLQAVPPSPELGAEYVPSDLIYWIRSSQPDDEEPN